MKDKPQKQIVQMAENELSPKRRVRVSSLHKQSVHPDINLMLSEKDKYTKVDIDTYQRVFTVVSGWNTFDMATFTLQWPNGDNINITRTYLGSYQMPITESVIKVNETDGSESSGQVYVRNDTLATYEAFEIERKQCLPNVHIPSHLVYNLFVNQDADWDDVLDSCASGVNLSSIVLSKLERGVDNFVRDTKVRETVKFIAENYLIGYTPTSVKTAAAKAITQGLKSIVETIAVQVFGELSDESIEKVLKADVHISSIALVTTENKQGFDEELVYAVVKNDQLHLIFGALDKEDGINDLTHEFDLYDEDVTEDKLKTVKIIYPNLV
ncbi:hypothetical protein VPHK449_0054 [Vibrio phage K449]